MLLKHMVRHAVSHAERHLLGTHLVEYALVNINQVDVALAVLIEPAATLCVSVAESEHTIPLAHAHPVTEAHYLLVTSHVLGVRGKRLPTLLVGHLHPLAHVPGLHLTRHTMIRIVTDGCVKHLIQLVNLIIDLLKFANQLAKPLSLSRTDGTG